MKKIVKNIIVNYINVGGIFGFNEDNFIKINKELWKFVELNSKEVAYLEYILFEKTKEDLNVDYSLIVPNAQVSMTIDGIELHVIRLPKYIKTNEKGESTLIKGLLSYKYGDKEVKSISNAKFETVVKDLLQISR